PGPAGLHSVRSRTVAPTGWIRISNRLLRSLRDWTFRTVSREPKIRLALLFARARPCAGPSSALKNEAHGNVPNIRVRRIGSAGRSRTVLRILTDSARAARGALSVNEVRRSQLGDDRDQRARNLVHFSFLRS